MHFHPLPPELWADIFYWATYGPARELLTIPYFDSIEYVQDERQCHLALSTKHSLSLVCKTWRNLTFHHLYEDVHIRYGSHRLLNALQDSENNKPSSGYGRFVRRIVLTARENVPSDEDQTWATTLERRIMRLCPNLVVLSRYRELFRKGPYEEGPDEESMEDDSDSFLGSLKRIDWSNGVAPDRPRVIAPAPLVTWLSETLEVLSLGGDNLLWSPLQLEATEVIRLPRVHTLRIDTQYAFGVPGIFNYGMDLPSLRRVIIDKPESLYRLIECCLLRCGSHVKTIEIGAHYRCLLSDYVSTLLYYCPNLETLLFPIFWTRLLRWRRLRERKGTVFNRLTSVGLHSAQSPDVENSGTRWSYISGHFKAILASQTKFPSIRTVTLYGTEWENIVVDARFGEILDLAESRGVKLKCEVPASAKALAKAMAGPRILDASLISPGPKMTPSPSEDDPVIGFNFDR